MCKWDDALRIVERRETIVRNARQIGPMCAHWHSTAQRYQIKLQLCTSVSIQCAHKLYTIRCSLLLWKVNTVNPTCHRFTQVQSSISKSAKIQIPFANSCVSEKLPIKGPSIFRCANNLYLRFNLAPKTRIHSIQPTGTTQRKTKMNCRRVI